MIFGTRLRNSPNWGNGLDSRAILTLVAKAEEAASLLLRLGRKRTTLDLMPQPDAEETHALAA